MRNKRKIKLGKRQAVAHAARLQGKLQGKSSKGDEWIYKLIKKLLNILRQHFPGCAISKPDQN